MLSYFIVVIFCYFVLIDEVRYFFTRLNIIKKKNIINFKYIMKSREMKL